MLRGSLLALVAGVSIPAVGRADDLAALYPDGTTLAFGIDVKAITNSPLGKKVIGADKPFDATRKLLKALFPNQVFPITDDALKPLESVTNRLDRVTATANVTRGNWPPSIVVYLEGEIDEEEYFKAAEAIAKQESKPFKVEKLGERRLFVVGNDRTTIHGLRVSRSLFLIATSRDLIDEVLAKHAGKKRAKLQPTFVAHLKKVKPAETPIWLAVGGMEVIEGLSGVATIALKDDAEFRMEVACDSEDLARSLETGLGHVVDYLTQSQTPQAKLWDAARITVKRDNLTVTATGSIPSERLAEEYAKQK
jgi:hypothetical protein